MNAGKDGVNGYRNLRGNLVVVEITDSRQASEAGQWDLDLYIRCCCFSDSHTMKILHPE